MTSKRKPYKKVNSQQARYKRHRREWSKEELAFLKEKYGKVNTEHIAKTLGRTTLAVKQRARKVFKNLNIYEANCNYSLIDLGKALDNNHAHIIRSWIKRYEMPVIKVVNSKGTLTHYIVDLDNFWEWLEVNKHNVTINMKNVDLEVLDYYPEWFLGDVENNNSYYKLNKKKWSEEEVKQLSIMYYDKQMSIKEVALVLDRSYSSVADKISSEAKLKLTKVAI